MAKKKISKEVKSLAKEILKENKLPTSDEPGFAPFEQTEHHIIKEVIQPISLPCGENTNNPAIVSKSEREIFQFLENYFGSNIDDYFVHCENSFIKNTKQGTKKLKGILVEDKNGFRYNIWFDVTNISYL